MPAATTTPQPLQPGQTVLYAGIETAVVEVISADCYRLAGFAGGIPRRVIEPWTPAPALGVDPGQQATS